MCRHMLPFESTNNGNTVVDLSVESHFPYLCVNPTSGGIWPGQDRKHIHYKSGLTAHPFFGKQRCYVIQALLVDIIIKSTFTRRTPRTYLAIGVDTNLQIVHIFEASRSELVTKIHDTTIGRRCRSLCQFPTTLVHIRLTLLRIWPDGFL